MQVSEANANAAAQGETVAGQEPVENIDALYMTTESLANSYPLYASSLLNLVQNSENKLHPSRK